MTSASRRAFTIAAAVCGAFLAVAFAVVTPAGQPYDEPAHWANVQFYAQHHRMPELGEPGTQYEAQMGPTYYAISALILDGFDLGMEKFAFTILRFSWLFLVPLLGWLTYRLTRNLDASPTASIWSAAVVSLNPLLLSVGSSIQNDYLTIVLATVSVLVAVSLFRQPRRRLWGHVGLGALIGLAVLTKVVAIALLGAVLATQALRRDLSRRPRLMQSGMSVLGAAAVSGWWFVRNFVLYGDLTGAKGFKEAGVAFPPMRFAHLNQVVDWLGSIVSYVFLPVEYFRNSIDAPTPLVFVVLGAAFAVALVIIRRLAPRNIQAGITMMRSRPDLLFAVLVLCMTIATYLVYSLAISWIAARLMFLAAPVAAALFVRMLATRADWIVAAGVVGLFVVVDCWLLVQLSQLNRGEFWIF